MSPESLYLDNWEIYQIKTTTSIIIILGPQAKVEVYPPKDWSGFGERIHPFQINPLQLRGKINPGYFLESTLMPSGPFPLKIKTPKISYFPYEIKKVEGPMGEWRELLPSV